MNEEDRVGRPGQRDRQGSNPVAVGRSVDFLPSTMGSCRKVLRQV